MIHAKALVSLLSMQLTWRGLLSGLIVICPGSVKHSEVTMVTEQYPGDRPHDQPSPKIGNTKDGFNRE